MAIARRPAVSVVVFRDERVLLVRRGRGTAPGRWAPVGGAIEPGETAEAAAHRETAEETGVSMRLLGAIGRREVAGRADGVAFVWDLVVFAAAWVAGEPIAGDDAAQARFVALDEIATLDLVDGGAAAIAAARRLFDGSAASEALRNA